MTLALDSTGATRSPAGGAAARAARAAGAAGVRRPHGQRTSPGRGVPDSIDRGHRDLVGARCRVRVRRRRPGPRRPVTEGPRQRRRPGPIGCRDRHRCRAAGRGRIRHGQVGQARPRGIQNAGLHACQALAGRLAPDDRRVARGVDAHERLVAQRVVVLGAGVVRRQLADFAELAPGWAVRCVEAPDGILVPEVRPDRGERAVGGESKGDLFELVAVGRDVEALSGEQPPTVRVAAITAYVASGRTPVWVENKTVMVPASSTTTSVSYTSSAGSATGTGGANGPPGSRVATITTSSDIGSARWAQDTATPPLGVSATSGALDLATSSSTRGTSENPPPPWLEAARTRSSFCNQTAVTVPSEWATASSL